MVQRLVRQNLRAQPHLDGYDANAHVRRRPPSRHHAIAAGPGSKHRFEKSLNSQHATDDDDDDCAQSNAHNLLMSARQKATTFAPSIGRSVRRSVVWRKGRGLIVRSHVQRPSLHCTRSLFEPLPWHDRAQHTTTRHRLPSSIRFCPTGESPAQQHCKNDAEPAGARTKERLHARVAATDKNDCGHGEASGVNAVACSQSGSAGFQSQPGNASTWRPPLPPRPGLSASVYGKSRSVAGHGDSATNEFRNEKVTAIDRLTKTKATTVTSIRHSDCSKDVRKQFTTHRRAWTQDVRHIYGSQCAARRDANWR